MEGTFKTIKQAIGRRLLRGRVLEAWMRPEVRRLGGKYGDELIRQSTGEPARTAPPVLRTGSPLRRMLFISDVMWEFRELVPELEKICMLQTLNLNPCLQKGSEARSEAQIVAAALEELIKGAAAF